MYFRNAFHFLSRSELTNSGIINFSSIIESNGLPLQIVLIKPTVNLIEWPYEKYNNSSLAPAKFLVQLICPPPPPPCHAELEKSQSIDCIDCIMYISVLYYSVLTVCTSPVNSLRLFVAVCADVAGE